MQCILTLKKNCSWETSEAEDQSLEALQSALIQEPEELPETTKVNCEPGKSGVWNLKSAKLKV